MTVRIQNRGKHYGLAVSIVRCLNGHEFHSDIDGIPISTFTPRLPVRKRIRYEHTAASVVLKPWLFLAKTSNSLTTFKFEYIHTHIYIYVPIHLTPYSTYLPARNF
jgi:hypothetical protein